MCITNPLRVTTSSGESRMTLVGSTTTMEPRLRPTASARVNYGCAMEHTGPRLRRPPGTLRLDQALADRVADELDAVAHAQLLHRVRAMVLDRLLGQVEDLRDLAVRVCLGDQLHHLLLPRGQLVLSRRPLAEHVLDQRPLGLRGQEGLAALHGPDSLQEIGI